MPSIHDVAKRAKVSTATVSRVLSGGIASAAARDKVMAAVKATGYQPDARGRALRTGKTAKVGLILPDVSNPSYGITAKLVHDYIRQENYSLSLGCTYSDADEEIFLLQSMQREHVAGLIVSSTEGAQSRELAPLLNALVAAGTSVVLLGKKVKGFAADLVSVDNQDGMRQVGEYLVRTGRRRIGFIAGARGQFATEERLKGLRQGLAAGTGSIKPLCINCRGAYTMENGELLARELLEREQVDAIACGNDLMALGAIKACAGRNLSIPDDVAITGFDDIFVAETCHPRLTTVSPNNEQVIRTVCDLLFERIHGNGPQHCRKRIIPCRLIMRNST